jgi:P-type Ca2+ transporter type 2C
MGCLFGFIISFLGAAIFDIGGVPFLPLQTLWINFTTLLFQAIGLGYGAPAAGLMDRKPRQPDRPLLTRGLLLWLATAGLVIGVGTFADRTFVIWTGVSILTLILATVLGPLQTFLKTTSLDGRQWLICTTVALTIVAVAEIRKAVVRRNHPRMGDDSRG